MTIIKEECSKEEKDDMVHSSTMKEFTDQFSSLGLSESDEGYNTSEVLIRGPSARRHHQPKAPYSSQNNLAPTLTPRAEIFLDVRNDPACQELPSTSREVHIPASRSLLRDVSPDFELPQYEDDISQFANFISDYYDYDLCKEIPNDESWNQNQIGTISPLTCRVPSYSADPAVPTLVPAQTEPFLSVDHIQPALIPAQTEPFLSVDHIQPALVPAQTEPFLSVNHIQPALVPAQTSYPLAVHQIPVVFMLPSASSCPLLLPKGPCRFIPIRPKPVLLVEKVDISPPKEPRRRHGSGEMFMAGISAQEKAQFNKKSKRIIKSKGGVKKTNEEGQIVLHSMIKEIKEKLAIYFVYILNYWLENQKYKEHLQEVSLSDIVDCRDHLGRTPLVYCSIYNMPDLAGFLLAKNARWDLSDQATGENPLHIAVQKGDHFFPLIENLCRSRKFDLEAKDCLGQTALHLAVKSHGATHKDQIRDMEEIVDNKRVLELLLLNGTKVKVQDNNGETPIDWAQRTQRLELLEILSRYETKNHRG